MSAERKKKPARTKTAEETEAAPLKSLDPRRPDRLSRAILGPGRVLLTGWYLVCIASRVSLLRLALERAVRTLGKLRRGLATLKKEERNRKNQREAPAR